MRSALLSFAAALMLTCSNTYARATIYATFYSADHEDRPCIERGALLGPIVPLVHPDDPTTTSADVVQNCFSDFETRADPS
jgi:hypothetical protein